MIEHDLGNALNAVILALDKCVELAARPDTRGRLMVEKFKIGQIMFRAQLIMSVLETEKQSEHHKPNLRIVK